MSKYRLNHDVVVSGAVDLVNQSGPEALSLAEVAARFRVRTPSLYNHVQGLDGLRRDLALRGLRDQAAAMQSASAGLAGKEALRGVAEAYRAWAKANAGLYPYTLRTVEDGDEELRAVGKEVLDFLLAALRGYKLEAEQAIHAARAVRSAIHGFVSLEIANGFGIPVNLDASFDKLVDMLDDGLRNWA